MIGANAEIHNFKKEPALGSERDPKLEGSIRYLPLEPEEACGRGGRRMVGARMVEKTRPAKSTKQGSQRIIETEAAISEPTCVCIRSSANTFLFTWCFSGTRNSESGSVSTLSAYETLFPLLGSLHQP